MQHHILALLTFVATIISSGWVMASNFPPGSNYNFKGLECEVEEVDGKGERRVVPVSCLQKTNGGFLLPYFGTETKTIFHNAGTMGVNATLMFATVAHPNHIHSDEFAWFVLVTNRLTDPGRLNVDEVDSKIAGIVKERIDAGSGFKDVIHPKSDPDSVPTIFGAFDTQWSTVRMPVPSGYSVWMTRIRVKEPKKISECSEGDEIGKTSECEKTHFRFWLQSIDPE